MRPLALVLLTLALLKALSLTQLWSYKAGDTIYGLAFGDNGNLGAASRDHCAYIFDPNGNLLNKVCGNGAMSDASYCCGKFGFNNDDGFTYITDENGNLIKKVYVGNDYDWAITMTPDGFVACYSGCAFFNFNGNKLWDVDVGIAENGPAYYNGYWYVAVFNANGLSIIKDGSIIDYISYGEPARDTAVCGNYLVVTATRYLYLYDLSDPKNPREIWKVGGFSWANQVAFSPDCKYIAVADIGNYKLKIYDLKGNLVLEKSFGSLVFSVAWWRDRIAVGLRDGRIYVYKVEGYSPTIQVRTITSPQTLTFTTTSYVTLTKTVTLTQTAYITSVVTSATCVAPETIKEGNITSPLTSPFSELTKLYNEVSKSSGYKATILKGPFQSNIAYLATLAQLNDLYNRFITFERELKASIAEFNELLTKEPNFSNVYKMMNLVQKAKVNLAMMNSTFNQMRQIIEKMKREMPSVSCNVNKAKEVVNGILKATKIIDIIKYREEARKMGGLDKVVKCLFRDAMEKTIKQFEEFSKKVEKEMMEYKEKLKNYEELVNLLSVR